MPTPILMPALSPTMEEGTLSKWNVKEGDKVSSGDVIAEIETDKATMEVEAVDEGVVGKILVAEGTENVKVNDPIAVLVEEGESADDIDLGKMNGAAPSEPTKENSQSKAPEGDGEDAPEKAATPQPAVTGAADPELPADVKMVPTTIRDALLPGGSFRTFSYAHTVVNPRQWSLRRRMRETFPRFVARGPIVRNVPPAFVFEGGC